MLEVSVHSTALAHRGKEGKKGFREGSQDGITSELNLKCLFCKKEKTKPTKHRGKNEKRDSGKKTKTWARK